MVWVGSEDEPDLEGTAAAHDDRSRVRYEQRGTEMVRREEFSNGRVKFTPIANFHGPYCKGYRLL